MNDEPEEIHDMSRVEAYTRSRQKVAFLSAVWRPLLAGAAGAALVIGAVAVAQPKFITREIVVDHVVQKDVQVDHVVPHDVPVDHLTIVPKTVEIPDLKLVPRDLEITVPRIVQVAPPETESLRGAAPPAPPVQTEQDFTNRPEYREAQIKGHLVFDPDSLIRFDDGRVFVPANYDPVSKSWVQDFASIYLTQPYWGDPAFCNAIPGDYGLFKCLALHQGVVVDLETTRRPKPAKVKS